ncbi:hypothetical protein G6O67_005192 [Ophiocordyceps sinensis]|uniref:MFS transporter n=1 Tax=Ophiocordyceps sinensis TaxID=72228 RepID=A0A8H4PR58_9HYPO|nr:hypothetical protein G6O67_005192 [Ophiocordyceps sinensis]
MFFTLWATYFAYYARAYVLDILDGTQSTSLTMLLVMNAVGIPGRLVPALLADRYFGAVNVFIHHLWRRHLRLCMVFSIVSVAALTGPPPAGRLIEVTSSILDLAFALKWRRTQFPSRPWRTRLDATRALRFSLPLGLV